MVHTSARSHALAEARSCAARRPVSSSNGAGHSRSAANGDGAGWPLARGRESGGVWSGRIRGTDSAPPRTANIAAGRPSDLSDRALFKSEAPPSRPSVLKR